MYIFKNGKFTFLIQKVLIVCHNVPFNIKDIYFIPSLILLYCERQLSTRLNTNKCSEYEEESKIPF